MRIALSVKYKTKPNMIVIHPITLKFLRCSIKFKNTSKYPIKITGKVAAIIFKKSFLFLKKLKSCRALKLLKSWI